MKHKDYRLQITRQACELKLLDYRLLFVLSLILSSEFLILNSSRVYAQGVDLKDTYSFGNISSLGQALNFLVPYVFAFAGTAVVFYFIIGALRFVFSGGDKNTIGAAQQMMTHAIIGFILMILIFLVILFIPELFGLPRFRIIT